MVCALSKARSELSCREGQMGSRVDSEDRVQGTELEAGTGWQDR